MDYTVLSDPTALAEHAADIVESATTTSGQLVLGLAGGSTPRATYVSLARRGIDWSGTTAWMTDERWVGPEHDDANQRMVQETFVDPTGVEFLVPDTTIDSPARAAASFSDRIVPVVRSATHSIVLLGIGSDGHTASLFPGTKALDLPGARYVENYVDTLGVWRLTATFGLIAEADTVLFLVAGASKAPMIAEIAAGVDVPAAHITAKSGVHWLLDEAAAATLSGF